ncbi:MAG: GTP 3',8-cyclase MoaA [Planctomycetes bacterium]|nr:GTP 3',8-cyclase MoaA [Planctomycetota bacterium]
MVTQNTPIPEPQDTRQRRLRDLRISITDRCNLRCTYCMPADVFGPGYKFLPRSEILDYEELARLARISATLGVTKLRITGGEPLLRRDLGDFIRMLRRIDGIEDIALTTNGILLPKLAGELKAAGLDRVTVSLDSLDNETFGQLNGRGVSVKPVLEGIAAAEAAGLGPVKVNMVVQRGVNDKDILPMTEHFRGRPTRILRFIEFMDVGNSNGWRMEKVVPSREIKQMIHERWPVESAEPNYPGEVARRWIFRDGQGEVGFISSVTNTFCGDCTRARLSARGEFYTCLFAANGTDLRRPLRAGQSDDELRALIENIWRKRGDRYSEIRNQNTAGIKKAEMSYLGG